MSNIRFLDNVSIGTFDSGSGGGGGAVKVFETGSLVSGNTKNLNFHIKFLTSLPLGGPVCIVWRCVCFSMCSGEGSQTLIAGHALVAFLFLLHVYMIEVFHMILKFKFSVSLSFSSRFWLLTAWNMVQNSTNHRILYFYWLLWKTITYPTHSTR